MAMEDILPHLATGSTTVCRAWAVTRRDGVVLGFTDHDRALSFEGIEFRADSGMTARALQQSTGLSVDNTEAVGALSSDAISEADVLAGRYDAAEVRAWLVNWADVGQRVLQFRGSLGDIVRGGGVFKAEIRGLAEALNQPQGRVYQRGCSAILGDAQCKFDLDAPGFALEIEVEQVAERRLFRFAAGLGRADRWFENGRIEVLSGEAKGVLGLVREDRMIDGGRVIELWQRLGPEVATGDRIRLEPGCRKTASACRTKFNNFNNFRGFPHVPGEDWLMSYPVKASVNDGGSLFR